jgi:acetyl esterase/lipase
VRPDAPPFFVIHGSLDSLVPVEEGRRFVEALRAASKQPVCYLEVPDAQHAFDMFRSVRSHYTLRAIAQFLETVRRGGPRAPEERDIVVP